jgi:catechol 2,3-dioxygenase-like lactoylglutathione lyase family enzyme
MVIRALDHLVLTVTDATATRRFYVEGLGMRWVEFGDGRHALQFGTQKINLHYRGREFEPKAAHPTPGSADLCFLTDESLEVTAERMARLSGWHGWVSPSSKARCNERVPWARFSRFIVAILTET